MVGFSNHMFILSQHGLPGGAALVIVMCDIIVLVVRIYPCGLSFNKLIVTVSNPHLTITTAKFRIRNPDKIVAIVLSYHP